MMQGYKTDAGCEMPGRFRRRLPLWRATGAAANAPKGVQKVGERNFISHLLAFIRNFRIYSHFRGRGRLANPISGRQADESRQTGAKPVRKPANRPLPPAFARIVRICPLYFSAVVKSTMAVRGEEFPGFERHPRPLCQF